MSPPTRGAARPTSDEVSSRPVWRRYGHRPANWWPETLLIAVIVVNTAVLLWPSPVVTADIAVRDYFDGLDRPAWEAPVVALTYFGRGAPLFTLCCVALAWVVWRYRTIRPVVLFLVAWLPLIPVYYIKEGMDRVAPHFPEPDHPPYVDAAGAVLGVQVTPAASFPSGHAVNSIIFFGVLLMVIGQVLPRVARILLVTLPPVFVISSVTVLGWHWLSDAPAGLAIGLLVMRLVARIPWETGRLPQPLRLIDEKLGLLSLRLEHCL